MEKVKQTRNVSIGQLGEIPMTQCSKTLKRKHDEINIILDTYLLFAVESQAKSMGKQNSDQDGSDGSVYRIPPYHFIHVLDQTTNVTRVEIGPNTFIRKDNEKVILGPNKMVIVPPRHYCVIRNPVKKDEDGEPIRDTLNQVRSKASMVK